MATILFYAGPDDNAVLREKISALGLRVYESEFTAPGVLSEAKLDQYHGIISFQSPSEMHPYPGKDHDFPYRIATVSDPVVMWLPSYLMEHNSDKYIIHGHLCWDFEDATRGEELARGKSVFGQLSRWLRKHWPPPAKRGVCRGPQAQKLIQFESYIPKGLRPDIPITYVKT